MKGFILLFFVFQATSAVMHSWKAFYTGSTGLKDFPEFVALNLVDDELMGYFDSRTNRFEAKQNWVTENLGQDYLERQTNILQGYPQTFKGNIDVAMKRFNQTKGVHIAQRMVGCEWDDETNEVKGYFQDGYDGEDFIAFNLETEQWIAPKPEAVYTKHKWENDKANAAYWKNYLTQVCPEWVKKYVNYGRSSLMRKALPSVSLLQKTPSSPVSCHATGFYPDRAMMFWRKDGEEIHEGVERGEILPNHDGSFQMKTDLDISSVSPEDWRRYECVFQLSGVEDDIITKLESKSGDGEFPTAAVIGVGVFAALLLLTACVAVVFWSRRKNGFKRANTSDTSSSSTSEPENEKAPLA